ncbi:MAG: CotD family spore coat protein [Bacilli bacterium]
MSHLNANAPYGVSPAMKGDVAGYGMAGHGMGGFGAPVAGGYGMPMGGYPGHVAVAPAVVHPTNQQVVNSYSTVIVPHIHPTHTQYANHQMIQNQHHFPQSCSQQQCVQQSNVNCAGNVMPMNTAAPMNAPMNMVAPMNAPMNMASPAAKK